MDSVLFSSKKEEWATPQDFFDSLDAEFHFDLDPCALPENAKCKDYYTPEDDGLIQDWCGRTVFCNPPYGRKVKLWVSKCLDESKKPNTTVVLLAPARTDTRWFHDYVYGKADEIRFIRGRLKFGDGKNSAPFPSLVAVYRSKSD